MDEGTLKNLAEQKEKEWRCIQEKRIEFLEKSLKEKSQDLTEEKSKNSRLKEDFKYNLKLLEERDADLEKYEKTIVATRKQLSEKNSEISELKIKIDELKKFKESEKTDLEDTKKYYLGRLSQKQNEIDKYKAQKDAEINIERQEIEKYKRTLKREIQDLQIDLETQRNELRTEFDSVMRKREHEWRLQTEEFSNRDLAKDLQIKMLTNEVNQMKEAASDLKVSNDDTSTSLKSLERKLKEKEWELKDTIALKDARIGDIEARIAQFQANANKANEDLNRKNDEMDKKIREKDVSIEKLKLTISSLEKNISLLDDQISAYKDQLKTMATENADRLKEHELEKLQLNEFNKQILETREQCMVQMKSLEEKLVHKENVIRALQIAEPALNIVESETKRDAVQLKEENEKLKQVVKQMREEMENLALNESPSASSTVAVEANAEFVKDLESQLLDVKQKNRQLQTKLDEYMLAIKAPDSIPDNTIINSHIKTLNETVSILRKEKMDLTAFCKKQQAKLQHIERLQHDQSEQARLKQTQIETLQYEMSSQARRNTTEINNLKQTLANCELELSATRKEADEYHKGTIEKGSEVAALESMVSELKMKLSTSGTQVNFGAQEMFIQQLQDEIKRLSRVNSQLQMKARQSHHQALRSRQETGGLEEAIGETKGLSVNDLIRLKEVEGLKVKLKSAARFISHLIQEKEHLIEMSNQLRGELNRIKYDNESLSLVRINRDVTDALMEKRESSSRCDKSISPAYKDALQTRLQDLEKKQYELTKKQLTFAQKKGLTKSDSVLNKEYQSSNYKDSDILTTSTDDVNTVYSSVKSEHLKDIWKIIDEHEKNPVLNSSDSLKVTGFKPKISNITFSKSPRKKSAQSPARLESKITKPKVRNYNDRT